MKMLIKITSLLFFSFSQFTQNKNDIHVCRLSSFTKIRSSNCFFCFCFLRYDKLEKQKREIYLSIYLSICITVQIYK